MSRLRQASIPPLPSKRTMFIISLTQQFPQPNNGNPLLAVIVQAWQVWEAVITLGNAELDFEL